MIKTIISVLLISLIVSQSDAWLFKICKNLNCPVGACEEKTCSVPGAVCKSLCNGCFFSHWEVNGKPIKC